MKKSQEKLKAKEIEEMAVDDVMMDIGNSCAFGELMGDTDSQ